MSEPKCLTAALEYLARGWSPLALCPPDHSVCGTGHADHCSSPGKRPLGKWEEYQRRRPSEAEIRAAWAKCPTANVGVALGPVSGLIGLDLDGPEADDLAAMIFGDLALTPTLWFSTPGGGQRLLYGCAHNCPLTKRRWNRRESHVILMGRGAQTVMPPSVHPNGKPYFWPQLRHDISPVPDRILEVALQQPEPAPVHQGPGGAAAPLHASLAIIDRARKYLATCDPAVSGSGGHNQTFKVAVKLVRGFGLSPEDAYSLLQSDFNPRCQPPWSEKELRHKVEEATKAPQPLGYLRDQPPAKQAEQAPRPSRPPAQPAPRQPEPPARSEEKKGPKDPPEYKPCVVTAADLYTRDFGAVRWAVEGLIPEGATILAGKPKMGKSWLALNIALAVASGGIALGKVRVQQGEVLYLALEDGPRRLQRRLRTLLEPWGATAPAGLLLTCGWARWNEGGLAAVAKWLEEHPATRLVVIDTLAKVRSRRTLGGGIYEEDYEAIGTIQSLALEAGVAVLIVTHTRKSAREEQESDDPLEEVSGSLGLTGAADCVLVLKRPRHGREGKLFLTGRDVEERTVGLEWDAKYCTWTDTGPEGPQLSEDQQRALDIVRNAGGPIGMLHISEQFGEGKSHAAIVKMVQRMTKDGLLRKTAYNQYTLPGKEADQEQDVSR